MSTLALPNVQAERPLLTVSEVNQRAQRLLERSFSSITVVGEISNLKLVSGHRYFNLKDPGAILPAALFRREAAAMPFVLKDGMQVYATGKLTLYGPYGRYQMIVERIEPKGAGALQAAFEQLKARLMAEGLFAAERKRPLPLLPRRVGVVTSPTGAVIRDIYNVSMRRFPNAQILVIPCKVQGAEAGPEIAGTITRAGELAQRHGLDVIIVARGGGSLEDLWGFNSESVARAIAACPVPVVSAVGHETDFTIADFVADRRAPTPSAAAELVFPVKSELQAGVAARVARMASATRRLIERRRLRITAARGRLGDGRAVVRNATQRVVHLHMRLQAATQRSVAQRRLFVHRSEARLHRLHPRIRLQAMRQRVKEAGQRMSMLTASHLRHCRQALGAQGRRLSALSPLGVLDRGYGIVLRADGQALRDPATVSSGDKLDILVAKGRLKATVD